MAKIAYVQKKFSPATMAVVRQAEAICQEYAAQGFDLTLRQLYYQFVARGLLANKQQNYKRLGSIVNDARLAGLIDWNHLEDRTRSLQGVRHFDGPDEVIEEAAGRFRLDKWERQPRRVEVWVEKEALAGVIQRAAVPLDVDFFSCRGYVSQSEQWRAGRRLRRYIEAGQEVTILHLGDHDPSGIDMTRDIQARLDTFVTGDLCAANPHLVDGDTYYVNDFAEAYRQEFGVLGRVQVNRIALTMDQVEEYDPPPNPAKLTDSRVEGYIARFGHESWELDALDPATLGALIEEEVEALRDDDLWDEDLAREAELREKLTDLSVRWDEISEDLG